MYDCEGCDREFCTFRLAQNHMNRMGHWGCETCSDLFWDEDGAGAHMDYYNHWLPEFKCEACTDRFHSYQDARNHMDAYNHWRNHWCDSCGRGFQNEHNLHTHLNSKLRQGSFLTCPFCAHSFVTASGVTAHLESGRCPSGEGLNRETILAQIRRRDPDHIITKKLITYPSYNVATTVSHACWNGYGDIHKQIVYHCPGHYCEREFVTLAGLFNHLESEVCGAVRFATVQRKIGSFLTGKKLISF